MHLKMSGKWRPFWLGINVLKDYQVQQVAAYQANCMHSKYNHVYEYISESIERWGVGHLQ